VVSDHCIGFDLDKHVAIDEPRHLDHARGRADRPEDFAVRFANVFPIANVGDIDARTDDIFEACADSFERSLNIFEHLDRLGVRITTPDDPAV